MSGSSGIGLPGALGFKYRGRFWLYPLSVRYVRLIAFSLLVLTSVLAAGCGDPLLTTTTGGGPDVQLERPGRA